MSIQFCFSGNFVKKYLHFKEMNNQILNTKGK